MPAAFHSAIVNSDEKTLNVIDAKYVDDGNGDITAGKKEGEWGKRRRWGAKGRRMVTLQSCSVIDCQLLFCGQNSDLYARKYGASMLWDRVI